MIWIFVCAQTRAGRGGPLCVSHTLKKCVDTTHSRIFLCVWYTWILGVVSKCTHWLLKEGNNLERSLYCACGGSYPRLSGASWSIIKCWWWKDCKGDLISLNTNNVNFCTRSRPYQRKVSRPSGPGRVFLVLVLFSLPPTPRGGPWESCLSVTQVWVYLNNHGTGFLGSNQTNNSTGVVDELKHKNISIFSWPFTSHRNSP